MCACVCVCTNAVWERQHADKHATGDMYVKAQGQLLRVGSLLPCALGIELRIFLSTEISHQPFNLFKLVYLYMVNVYDFYLLRLLYMSVHCMNTISTTTPSLQILLLPLYPTLKFIFSSIIIKSSWYFVFDHGLRDDHLDISSPSGNSSLKKTDFLLLLLLTVCCS